MSFIVFGSRHRFPPIFSLDRLRPDQGGDGSRGILLTSSVDEFEHAGTAVSGAGDVNGDGIDDVVVGAPFLAHDAYFRWGRAYVLFGSTSLPTVVALPQLMPDGGGDGSRGFVLESSVNEYQLGMSVSAAGDINVDGVDDVIVGAPGGNADASFVILGRRASP